MCKCYWSSQRESDALPMETTPENLISVPQVEMDDNPEQVETPKTSPARGTLITRTYELKKYKHPWWFKCKLCKEALDSVKELNAHHRSTHEVQFCDEYGKGFVTKTALDKHKYIHQELKFICDRCRKGFPFKSRLSQHKITHQIYVSLKCMRKNCNCSFKNVGDRNRHVHQHKKGAWFHCDFCDYKNKDKRNTDLHIRTHIILDEKYSCPLCN